jgi:hypothetical protein
VDDRERSRASGGRSCGGGGGGGGGGEGEVTKGRKDDATAPLRVDTVVMNPPFGTRKKGADMGFLRAALGVAKMAGLSV